MNKLAVVLGHYAETVLLGTVHSARIHRFFKERRVRRFLKRLCKSSPFYAPCAGKELSHFPLMTKTLFMEQFNAVNTKGIDRDEAFSIAAKAEADRDFSPMIGSVTVGLSSGTSGNRALFLADERERYTWAGVLLAKILPKPIWQKQKIALFLRANSNLYESLKSSSIQFRFFDLLRSADSNIIELESFAPDLIIAPPSMLKILAQRIAKGETKLTPLKLVSAAEVLDPLDEQIISEAFCMKVHQIYQCTEGFLGITCRYGTIHLNEEFIHIEKEFIDHEKRRFVPIVTDTMRTTQPIVRYRMNDILTEKQTPCPCGSPHTAVEQIEGRCDDIFYLPNQSGRVIPLFPDFIRNALISCSETILEYQVIQNSAVSITVKLLTAGDPQTEQNRAEAAVVSLCEKIGVSVPKIDFQPYDFTAGAVKLRRIIRRFTPEDSDAVIQ